MTQLKMFRGSFCIPYYLFLDEFKSQCGFDSCLEIAPELSAPISPAGWASATDVWTAVSTWLCRCQLGHLQFSHRVHRSSCSYGRLGFLSQGAAQWKLQVHAAFDEASAWKGELVSWWAIKSCACYPKRWISVCDRHWLPLWVENNHAFRDLTVKKRWSAMLINDSWTLFTGGLQRLEKPYVGWGVPGIAASMYSKGFPIPLLCLR